MSNTSLIFKQYRLSKDLTTEELGNLLGVSQGYISHIEKGIREPSEKILLKFKSLLESEDQYYHILNLISDILKDKNKPNKKIHDYVIKDENLEISFDIKVANSKNRISNKNTLGFVVEKAFEQLMINYKDEFFEHIYNNLDKIKNDINEITTKRNK
ncbi:helix-turn-helix domain-containing protein [Bacillus cytotoxicus]|uniref:helix-turn-helix domain-containing protein n=1 Tax=Bacillus cytotoxicus TaxID=580165 RepID=UPI003D7E7A95